MRGFALSTVLIICGHVAIALQKAVACALVFMCRSRKKLFPPFTQMTRSLRSDQVQLWCLFYTISAVWQPVRDITGTGVISLCTDVPLQILR